MAVSDMKVGLRYIVTQPSVNKEFQVGDRVRLLDSGDVLNRTAGGWMEAEHLSVATEGMQVELDKEWLQAQYYAVAQRLLELAELIKKQL